jgi:hypothetical protein
LLSLIALAIVFLLANDQPSRDTLIARETQPAVLLGARNQAFVTEYVSASRR